MTSYEAVPKLEQLKHHLHELRILCSPAVIDFAIQCIREREQLPQPNERLDGAMGTLAGLTVAMKMRPQEVEAIDVVMAAIRQLRRERDEAVGAWKALDRLRLFHRTIALCSCPFSSSTGRLWRIEIGVDRPDLNSVQEVIYGPTPQAAVLAVQAGQEGK